MKSADYLNLYFFYHLTLSNRYLTKYHSLINYLKWKTIQSHSPTLFYHFFFTFRILKLCKEIINKLINNCFRMNSDGLELGSSEI